MLRNYIFTLNGHVLIDSKNNEELNVKLSLNDKFSLNSLLNPNESIQYWYRIIFSSFLFGSVCKPLHRRSVPKCENVR